MSTFVTAEVPSNIAFIKYWGKLDSEQQVPANSSISMTLNQARTVTSARLQTEKTAGDSITKDGVLLLPGSAAADKAYKHLAFLRQELGFEARLEIQTKNTFPSECGIASSASGLGALTLAAVATWTGSGNTDDLQLRGYTLPAMAALARMGSGSACRSFFGGYVEWNSSQSIDKLASHTEWSLADLIVIVSSAKKPVSSTVAHKSAWSSPLFRPRLAGLNERLEQVRHAIETKNLPQLGQCIEADALEMHAVMMTSVPPANYITSDSESVITWVRSERSQGGFDAWFTMDAGPNVHIICAAEHANAYAHKIKERFPEFQLIADTTGGGPVLYRGLPS